MKVTVAVLNKHGDNVVEHILDVLNTLSDERSSHFGLISPKKTVLEKSLGILRRQGLNSSTLVGFVSSKPASASRYEFLQFDDTALVFQGKVYSAVPETAAIQQLAKEPQHCKPYCKR